MMMAVAVIPQRKFDNEYRGSDRSDVGWAVAPVAQRKTLTVQTMMTA